MSPGRAFTFTVREITQYLRTLLAQDRTLQDVWVRGEIADFLQHSSGHVYCTLKDDTSQLRCVMFRNEVQGLTFTPTNGMEVTARGTITVYEARGQYQFVMREMQQAGLGDLHLRFARLKARLEAEGLFAESRKRPLPAFPRRIAVLTSMSGAAIHDILITLRSRWPAAEVVLVYTPVSGPAAVPGIVGALQRLRHVAGLEVAILARGGGSMEELSAFNDEQVARAIAAAPVPVVTGLGHETDFTIADFTADRRAPTPTGAAIAVSPDRDELLREIRSLRRAAAARLERRVRSCRRELSLICGRPILKQPQLLLAERAQRLDETRAGVRRRARELVHRSQERLARAGERLKMLSPAAVLARGYAVMRLPDGSVVRSARQLQVGAPAEVILHEGTVDVKMTRVRLPAGEEEGDT